MPKSLKIPVRFARFEPTQTEIGCTVLGRPSYRWAPAVHIITPDGLKLFPPVQVREARRICRAEGWTFAQPPKKGVL